MYSKGEYEFLGYLVHKAENNLLILVPDDIPDVENTQEDDAGVYIKAVMSRIQFDNEKDRERLVPGIMVFGVGQISIPKDALPEVFLHIFHVLWRKRDGLKIPDFLIETFLDDVSVKSHLRKLPAGNKASEEQIRKALAKGIILPDGYTYVSDHERTHEKEIKNPEE
jgi:hypothetical protein